MKVRRYEQCDESQVLALWNTAWWADKTTVEFFREKILMEPNIGEEGLFVAEDKGNIVGAANAFVRSTDLPWGYAGKSALHSKKGFLFPVFPAPVCKNGVGQELLAAAEAYLRGRGRTIVSVCDYLPLFYADGIDKERYPEVHGLLTENGYDPKETTRAMSCDLRNHSFPDEARRAESRLGEEGITFTSYHPQHLLAVKKFLLKEFPAWISCLAHKVIVRAPWHEVVLGLQGGDQVIAYCQYNYYGVVERVGPFGVASAMQGRGVGYVLVAYLLQTMAERGYQLAFFGSAGERQANFYAKNGFTVFREKTIFEKKLL